MPPTPDDTQRGLTRYTREVLHSATVDIVSKALSAVLLAGLAGLGLLIWHGGSVPAWLLAVALVLLVAAVVAARARGRRVDELLPIAEQAAELDGVVDLLTDALMRHDEYTRHVAVVLDNLQRVVVGALNVDLREYIERGILEPARDLLTQAPDENVRLSVLVPEGEHWRMMWSAGHSLAGREGYNQPIANTLSRHALETGRTQKWDDVLRCSASEFVSEICSCFTPSRSACNYAGGRSDGREEEHVRTTGCQPQRAAQAAVERRGEVPDLAAAADRAS